jgi:hypothetical protein
MKNFIDIFSDFASESASPKIPLTVRSFKTIHRNDWEPVSIINPNIDIGPWIAGGAPLRWWQNQPVSESDIDIFCRDAIQAQEVIERITSQGRYSKKYESENAVTLLYWNEKDYNTQWTLQVIKKKYYKSLKEVISGFDITVCEIGTCGNEWELGIFTARDIHNKVLNFKVPLQPDALKRLIKYWVYGYEPMSGTIEAIQNNPQGKWEYTIDEDYNNAF